MGFRTGTSTWKLENIFIVRHLQSSPQFLVLLLNLGFTRRTSRRVASSAELLLIRVGPTSAQTVYSQSEFVSWAGIWGRKVKLLVLNRTSKSQNITITDPRIEKCQQSGLSFNIVITFKNEDCGPRFCFSDGMKVSMIVFKC